MPGSAFLFSIPTSLVPVSHQPQADREGIHVYYATYTANFSTDDNRVTLLPFAIKQLRVHVIMLNVRNSEDS